jgi:hypothetical protein
MKTPVTLLAIVLVAIVFSPAGAAERGDVVVGRVEFVESCGGLVIVDFPFGRRQLLPAPGEIDHYVFYQGKELVFDRDLLPLWNAPLPARSEPVSRP